MDHQQLSDQIEIQQLCARYMMLSARKDNDHWARRLHRGRYVQRVRHALRRSSTSRCSSRARPRGSTSATRPSSSSDGDTATGVQHYVFIDQTSHEMRLAWYEDDYVRTDDGWRIRSRSTTFMRRSGGFDHGNAHDPARFVAGQEIE